MDEGLVIGIRPIPRHRIDPIKNGFPKKENIPETMRSKCESFGRKLEELPNVHIDGLWRDSEEGWFYLMVIAIGLASNIATIASFILKLKEEKIREKQRIRGRNLLVTMRFAVTISRTAYPHHLEEEELKEDEDIESIKHRLEISKTDLAHLKEQVEEIRHELERLRRGHVK